MGNVEVPVASLSLTHVNYNPEDPISYLCALFALVPQALCIIYVTLIWASREVEIVLMFTGQAACEALNFILKRVIRQERPPQMYGNGYGMPSSHSQFVAFFSLSLTLFLLIRHDPDPSTNDSPTSFAQRAAVSILANLGASAVAVSRMYLSYHTPQQVLAGYAIGMVCAVAWFSFASHLRQSGWISWAVDSELSRILRMRDLLTGEDLAEGGWQRWETRRKVERQSWARTQDKIK